MLQNVSVQVKPSSGSHIQCLAKNYKSGTNVRVFNDKHIGTRF